MNKEQLKEFLSWMVDKGYINLTGTNSCPVGNNSLHLSRTNSCPVGNNSLHLSRTMRDAQMEFYQEKREQKLNNLLG